MNSEPQDPELSWIGTQNCLKMLDPDPNIINTDPQPFLLKTSKIQTDKTEKHSLCLAPTVWAFLSTTVQLPATQRKVEGGERDI